MTDNDPGWLRRLVGGRARNEAEPGNTGPQTQSLPPAEEDLAARLELFVAQNTQLAEVNGRQAHQLQQLEALLQEATKNDATQKLKNLTAEFQTQQRSLRAARAAAEQASARTHNLLQQVASLEREEGQQHQRADQLEASTTGLHTQLRILREQARRTQKHLQSQKDLLDQGHAQREGLEKGLKQAGARATELREQLAATQTQVAQHQARADRCEGELSALKKGSVAALADLAGARADAQAARGLHEDTIQRVFGPSGPQILEKLLDPTLSRDEGPR